MALHSFPMENNAYKVSGGALVSSISSASVIEDWETGSVSSDWTVDSAGLDVVENNTLNGSHHLHAAAGDEFARLWSFEGDGLPDYYEQGEGALTFLTHTDSQDNHVAGVYYGVVDADHNYFTIHDSGNFELVAKVNGTNSVFASVAATCPADTVLRWEVRWDDGTQGGTQGDHQLDVYDNSDDSEIVSISRTNDTSVEDDAGSLGAGHGVFYNDGTSTWRMDQLQIESW